MPSFEDATDRALMRLPYEHWVSVEAAALHAEIDKNAAGRVIRAGRRRGVLRTRGKGATQQVMRVSLSPRCEAPQPKGSQK